MEREIMQNASTLCRICFEEGRFHIDSHQMFINDEIVELNDILSEFSSLEICQTENVPSLICINCADELAGSYMTLQKVRKSDEQIRRIYDIILKDDETSATSQEESQIIHSEAGEIVVDDERNLIDMQYTDEYTSSCDEIISDQLIECAPNLECTPRTLDSDKDDFIVLPENVSEILSNTDESTVAVKIERTDPTLPTAAKKKKFNSGGSRFIVSKFILTEPTKIGDIASDINRDDLLESTGSVSHVRMLDMAAVELRADEKISLELDDDETNVENPNTMYMCKYCPRAFSTSHHLIMHARKSHVCQFCAKGFEKVTDLHKHTKEAHNAFNCTLCKRDFSSNSNLKQHMKRVHNIELPAHVTLLSVKVVGENDT